MISETCTESRGQHNESAVLALSCVKMDYAENVIYQKYKINFTENLKHVAPFLPNVFDDIPNIIRVFIRKHRGHIHPSGPRHVEGEDVSCIIHLLHKVYKQATKYGVPVEKIPLFTEKFLPCDFEKSMEIHLERFRNHRKPWQEALLSIWNVSKCQQIVKEKRRRLLYKKVTEEDITSYMDFYKRMYGKVVPFLSSLSNGKISCNTYLKHASGLYGRLDFINHDTMIEYTTCTDDSIKSEQMTYLLASKQIFEEEHDVIIKTVGCVNLLTGRATLYDVQHYDRGQDLLDYLLSKK